MSRFSRAETERVSKVARDLGTRARADPAYLQQLDADPVGTMLAAGLPPEAVIDILAEEGFEEDEVQGYLSLAGVTLGSLGPTLVRSPGGLLAAGCDATFSCLCASADGCCFSSKGSAPLPDGGLRGTPPR